MKIQDIVRDKVFLILCLIIIVVDLLYPVTFSYDSGKFFSYFKILSGELSWENWDPVRGIVFPVYLKIVTDIFGTSINSFIIPAILFHLFLFFCVSYFVLSSFNDTSSLSKQSQSVILILIFVFIVFDPLIMGFYHAVLTEYIASTIALLSCLLSYLMYRKVIKTKENSPLFFIFFSILVIFSWHLKQPYFGAALFPFILTSLFIIYKQKKRALSIQIFIGNFFIVVMLVISIIVWDIILPNKGAASDQSRNTSSFINSINAQNLDLIKTSPINFIKNITKNYLALSNIFFFDQVNLRIEKTFSITRASDNGSFGYRLFTYGLSNMALPAVYPEEYMENIRYYSSYYYPPLYLNRIFQLTTIKSTILFSTLYLSLPIIFFILSIYLIVSKKVSNGLVIIYLCSGSAFLNAIEHSFLNNPVDRYLFWGYPLLLTSMLITIIFTFNQIASLAKIKWRKSTNSITYTVEDNIGNLLIF